MAGQSGCQEPVNEGSGPGLRGWEPHADAEAGALDGTGRKVGMESSDTHLDSVRELGTGTEVVSVARAGHRQDTSAVPGAGRRRPGPGLCHRADCGAGCVQARALQKRLRAPRRGGLSERRVLRSSSW